MKLALALSFVAISIAVASASQSCMTDANKCKEDECCVSVNNLSRKCRTLKKEGEKCVIKPRLAYETYKVYSKMCPCAQGLKCIRKDGLKGKLGTCQEDRSEVVETEAPEEK